MKNEERTDLRKDSILALAKIIKQGRDKLGNDTHDLSEFSTKELSEIGMSNLILARYLHEVGYQMSDSADVTVIVENGQVTGIYSNNEDIAAEVIDLDVQDAELLEHLKASAKKTESTQLPVW